MAKIPFNINYRPQIESGEYKVVTSAGDPVRILAWDLLGDYPIAAADWPEENPEDMRVETYDENGWDGIGERKSDLYIVTPEPAISKEERKYLAAELTDFLANYEREFDDDAPLSEVAEYFFFVGKKYEREHPAAGDTELNAIAFLEQLGYTCIPPHTGQESEGERIRRAALNGIEYLERELGFDSIGDIDILDVKDYLEKQKEQKPYEPHNWPADKDNLTQEQKPAEWSEEDEKKRRNLRSLLVNMRGDRITEET